MKIAFELTTIPPSLYLNGEGKCSSRTTVVEIPDNLFPADLVKIANGETEHTAITNITVAKVEDYL